MKALLIAILTFASFSASALSKFESSKQQYLAIASNEDLAASYPFVVFGIVPKQFSESGLVTEYFVWVSSREVVEGKRPEFCRLIVEVTNTFTDNYPNFVVSKIDPDGCNMKIGPKDSLESWSQMAAVLSTPELNVRIDAPISNLAVSELSDGSASYLISAMNASKVCHISVAAKDRKVLGVDFTRCEK